MSGTITRRAIIANSIAASALCLMPGCSTRKTTVDVAIYGATPGGIAAAVAAARMGKRVLLCEYVDHIGGIVSNGLTNADIGKRQAVGGLFYEFTQRVVRYYESMDAGNPGQSNVKLCRGGYWYEANAAERIFHEMIAEQEGRIQLLLSHELKSATVESNRLTAIELEPREGSSGRIRVEAPVFVDATYEGDLAAMAKAPFRTGRESRDEYNEPHAGRIYMRFRETELLPGSTGEADDATQAYCFRFHVTNVPEKRVPIEKPAGYNRDDYRLVLEDIRAGLITTFRHVIQVYPMPNGRFELNSDHVNQHTGIPKESLDLAEECWPWPTATPAERRKIYERYLSHNVGLIWLLQNDPEVPEALRQDALQFGWHRDEWTDNKHVPRQVYVRQGRRILGEYVLTERDADLVPAINRTKLQPSSIATIEWAFDPHGHHHYDPAHPGTREGYFFVLHEPFQVPYGVLVPRQIDGLLVPVACSCSHVAYNALRMEPVFMALGEASGMAAHLAIDKGVALRGIDTAQLQALLVERRAVVTFLEDLPFADETFAAMQWLGARGFNTGYRADRDAPLTERDAADRLGRVLISLGKNWQAPELLAAKPLSMATVADWLQQAGYPGLTPPANESTAESTTVGHLATVLYRAMRS
ncbi:MAG: FAD-dependent oxidoreductase [Bryobacterales bacterium]|nr:FAD-dependent oxidoreductase [Bryobacterales bacterium]